MIGIFIVFMAGIFSFIMWKGYENTKKVSINSTTIHEEFSEHANTTLTVLHLSDLHLEHISITPVTLFNILKDQQIDLIALTGDFLDRKRTLPKLKPYLEMLNKLKPTYGTFAVFGNHDYILQKEAFNRLKKMLNEYGIHTMQNENTTITINGVHINIIGIDDYRTKHSNLEKSYRNIQDGYNLVLTHDPNIILEMEKYPVDLLLAGHFHGGQICWPKPYQLTKMPTMGKLPKMNMIKGLHRYKGKTLYINEGLGQTGLNIRFGSRPEITLHHIVIPLARKSQMIS
mgnify:CR=1 FL=1